MPMHGSHGEMGEVRYGHFDFDVDPLRYTQPPGTHWYHAHKHGSTALQVLNGLVGTFEIRGEFDADLDEYFETEGGGTLADRLMVVQQLQEKSPGLGGADQTGSILINGQANPVVSMAPGEIQRWRFVGATMQASAALRIGFPDVDGVRSPEVRQIAMDGVQFSPENYACQPFLNNPDCTPVGDTSEFQELTTFKLSPGNRIDVLVKAPDTPGTHCMVHEMTSDLPKKAAKMMDLAMDQKAAMMAGTCGISNGLAPIFTLVVEDGPAKNMTFPEEAQSPRLATYLADIPPVTDTALQKDIYYQRSARAVDVVEQQRWGGSSVSYPSEPLPAAQRERSRRLQVPGLARHAGHPDNREFTAQRLRPTAQLGSRGLAPTAIGA